jgi:hypothetical protein
VCREHPIPISRDYGPIKSFKLTLNHSASCTVLHHRDGLITNLLNKIINKHKLTVPYLTSLVTSFPIKPHSWDLQSRRLGINHSVIIWVLILSPSMLLSLAFLLVAWSKNLQNSFMTSQSPWTYTSFNKLPHNIVHFLTIKLCSLLKLWQPINHTENIGGTELAYKSKLIYQ